MELKWKNSTAVESDWPGTDTDVASVPGGWIVRSVCVGVSGIPSVMAMVFVPDPTAPHCQPTPPADDRPPMTDDALTEWCIKRCQHFTAGTEGQRQYIMGDGQQISFDGAEWRIEGVSKWEPAHVAGPALHAAHRYGTP
jgi:hypothetical protein